MTAKEHKTGSSLVARPEFVLPIFLVQHALLILVPGHLAILAHEIDVMHATDMALRVARGELPHLDFMTPLGILTTLPVAGFISIGIGVGTAFLLSNILMAVLFLPLILRVLPRLGAGGMAFGLLVLLMLTALIYGGTGPFVSMSMNYNRWGWAAVMIAAVILLFPRAEMDRGDGVVLGLCLGYLALLKMTFFVAMAPVVLLVCVIDRAWTRLLLTGIAGGMIAVLATLFLGFEFWFAYYTDLVAMIGSEVRATPGATLGEVISGPTYLPISLLAVATIIVLRNVGGMREGLVLLLLTPGFAYIVFQNWGNDPKWLLPVGFAALVWARTYADAQVFGTDGKTVFTVIATAAFAFLAPSFLNMAISTTRNLTIDRAEFMAILDDPQHDDLIIAIDRSYDIETIYKETGVVPPGGTVLAPIVIAGIPMKVCNAVSGYVGWVREISARLEAAGFSGSRVAMVDLVNHLPLVGPFEPVPRQSPWYYGGLDGFDAADYLLVPRCPMGLKTRKPLYTAFSKVSSDLVVVHEDRDFWLFKRP